MVKKLGLIFLLAILTLTLVGCTGGSYKITIGEIKPSQNELSGKYHSFTGYYYKKVTLEKGENLTVKFKVETEKGELYAEVINANGKTIKTLKTGDTANLNEPGQYKLQVEGEKHKGNFKLSWDIKR